jgi:hypothetical protein
MATLPSFTREDYRKKPAILNKLTNYYNNRFLRLNDSSKLIHYGGQKTFDQLLEDLKNEDIKLQYKFNNEDVNFMNKKKAMFYDMDIKSGGGFKVNKKWVNIGLIGLLIVAILFLILIIVFVFTDNITGLKVISICSSILLVVVSSYALLQYKINNPDIVDENFEE